MEHYSINTYNESSLHNTLKAFYARLYDGKTEVKADGHIYDVLTKDGTVIEIQTKNLSKLYGKLSDTLSKGHRVKLIYPLIYRTRIITTDENGNKISSRLSPKKGCIYDMFRELTGLYSILLNPDFMLEVIKINMIEHRIKYKEPVQTANKSRRFKRDWLKVNKRLEEIIETYTFNSPEDYLKLLPENLPEEFCAKDFNLPKYAHLIIWVLVRMEVIRQTGIKKRSRYYKITERQ